MAITGTIITNAVGPTFTVPVTPQTNDQAVATVGITTGTGAPFGFVATLSGSVITAGLASFSSGVQLKFIMSVSWRLA